MCDVPLVVAEVVLAYVFATEKVLSMATEVLVLASVLALITVLSP